MTILSGVFFVNGMNYPSLSGLVLAGGFSSRMGRDKGSLVYHGVSQRAYCAALLAEVCDSVFISCRPDQQTSTENGLKVLMDGYERIGPLGGVLTAFEANPESAWFVLACDMPFVTREALEILLARRNPAFNATAFVNPETQEPEPLCAIYEPSIYPVVRERFHQGLMSLKAALQNVSCELVEPHNKRILTNINTPEEYKRWRP